MCKILLITNNFLPHHGGSRIYYYHIYKNLGFERVSVLTKFTMGWEEFDRLQDFNIHRIDLSESEILRRAKLQQLKPVTKLIKKGLEIIYKEKIKIIHCGELLPTGLACYTLSKITGIPYLVYIHDEQFGEVLRYQPKIKKFLCQKVAGIICACSFSKRKLIKEGFDETKLPVIIAGVDIDHFSPRDDKQILKKHSIEKKKILLTVSRLEVQKGHDFVIKSLPKILEKVPDIVYLIIGEGIYENELKKLV